MGQTMVKDFKETPPEAVCHKHPLIASTIISIFTFGIFLTFGLLYALVFNNNAFVLTKDGPVEGFFVTNRFQKNVKIFYGIPYAEPPIGKLRFANPKPKKPWIEKLIATDLPNACPQSFDGIRSLRTDSMWKQMQTINTSEDCLYLNIFVPTENEKNRKRVEYCNSNNEIKAVMVYFYRGSFQFGANSLEIFDATDFTAFGNVIIVVPNYRIGILGFLSSQPQINGNFGLYDQLEVLKWVQRNIAAFGGDPDRVVLFGQNDGAISIGLHLISPLSRNLFKRAILESGNALSPITVLSPDSAKDFTIKVANTSKCPFVTLKDENNTETYSINNKTIDCLMNLSVHQLIEAQNKVLAKVPISLFTPVMDGQFFVEPTLETTNSLKFGPYSEIMIGSNAMEGNSFLRSFAEKMNISIIDIKKNFTKIEIKNFLLKRVPEEQHYYIDMGLDEAFDESEVDGDNTT